MLQRSKSLGLDGLPCELYSSMPGLFAGLLADVFYNRQQNEKILKSVSGGAVSLLKEGRNRKRGGGWGLLDSFRPIALLNADMKILAKVLVKRLELVIETPKHVLSQKVQLLPHVLHHG